MATQNNLGQTLLQVVAKQGPGALHKARQLIHAGAGLNMRDHKGESALSLASIRGNFDVCELLLNAGSDVNCKNHQLEAPLHHAVKRCDVRLSGFLLDRGADIAAESASNHTALHAAVIVGNKDLLTFIISRGPPLEARNAQTNTPLLLAAGLGRTEACLQLLKAGADITVINRKGQNVLHRAAERGFSGLCNRLITLGADATLKDNDGNTFSELLERGEAKQKEKVLKKEERREKKEEKKRVRMEQQNTSAPAPDRVQEKAVAVGVQGLKRSVDAAGLVDHAPQEKRQSVDNGVGAGAMHVDEEGEIDEEGEVDVDVDDRLRVAEAQANYMPERAEFEARLAAESRLRKAAEEQLVVALEALGSERDERAREVNALNRRVAELLERAARAETAANEYRDMAVSAEAAVRVLESRIRGSAQKLAASETLAKQKEMDD